MFALRRRVAQRASVSTHNNNLVRVLQAFWYSCVWNLKYVNFCCGYPTSFCLFFWSRREEKGKEAGEEKRSLKVAMEDVDGGLSFDFEGVFEFSPVPLNAVTSSGGGGGGGGGGVGGAAIGRKNYRQTVCRHWLRGLCMNGDACGFLHQYDKARMPVCRFFVKFGECRELDCIYKHTNEDIKECNMYCPAAFVPFASLPNFICSLAWASSLLEPALRIFFL